MIEKEIDLIENRTSSEPFAKGLNKLEKVMKELITNKDLEDLEALLFSRYSHFNQIFLVQQI